MPYSVEGLRGDKADHQSLWEWGIFTRSGYGRGRKPMDPDRPRLAANFGSRLPADDWFMDYTLAFLYLNPRTARLSVTADFGFYVATGQASREQIAIWLYYVEGLGYREWADQFARLPVERRNLVLDLMSANPTQFQTLITHTSKTGVYRMDQEEMGDAAVARLMPNLKRPGETISRQRASEIRNAGIDRMVGIANDLRGHSVDIPTRVA